MERGSNLDVPDIEAKVKQPLVSILIDEGVCVVLQEQVCNNPALCHEPKQIEVAPEEYVKAHFYMVAIPVLPGGHLPSHEWPLVIQFHFVSPIQQLYSSRKPSQPSTNDDCLQLWCAGVILGGIGEKRWQWGVLWGYIRSAGFGQASAWRRRRRRRRNGGYICSKEYIKYARLELAAHVVLQAGAGNRWPQTKSEDKLLKHEGYANQLHSQRFVLMFTVDLTRAFPYSRLARCRIEAVR